MPPDSGRDPGRAWLTSVQARKLAEQRRRRRARMTAIVVLCVLLLSAVLAAVFAVLG